MKLISNNPYRIAGILSNASAKEFEKQKSKFKAFAKVGKELESAYDFQILQPISRNLNSINIAFSNIQQSQDKVNFALFWFLNANPFDNTAIEYLKNGDGTKAVEIWEKVTINKDVNSRNFSAFNNLGTYKLLCQTQNDLKEGIEAKIKLIESEYFENFVHSVADETFTIDNEKQIEQLVDALLTQFKNQYSSSETLQLFSGCNGSTQKYLSKKFTEEPIHKIEIQIESSKKNRKENIERAYEIGLRLFTNTKEDLTLLKSLLGTSDIKYKSVADQLASEIMQCGIDYFNENKKNNSRENYIELSQKLTKFAWSIAVGKLTKDRAKDSLATLAAMKDREVDQAIQVLESIKDAYEKNQKDIYRMIAEKGIPVDRIDYSKVINMVENSINWEKAVELIYNIIPPENISKIKNSNDISKVNEYKELVDFVLGKLKNSSISYTYKVKIKYLKYWQLAQATKSTTSSTSSTSNHQSTRDEGIPDWLKWVGGIILFIILIKACN
ncbi:hypothetical protein MWU76_15230 [Gelidibacter sp. F2691]|nr:hypothetical protein [Gelidibacter sp. F2691]